MKFSEFLNEVEMTEDYATVDLFLSNPSLLASAKDLDPELVTLVVSQRGFAIQYVENPTYEMRLAAVTQNGDALQFIGEEDQSEEICLTAVRQTGYALKNVAIQTPQICLEAVTQNSEAFQFVKEQDHEICFTAVSKDGWLLKLVNEQTPAICIAAVKNVPSVIVLVDKSIFEPEDQPKKGVMKRMFGGMFGSKD